MTDRASSAGYDDVRNPQADDPVELVLRHHLPVRFPDNGPVLCLCDVTQTYVGGVGHRLHVVDELRKAGLLRD